MNRAIRQLRAEARRLFLSLEMNSNTDIAARLGVKPHTVGRWRKEELWDDIKFKSQRRSSEQFVEKIGTDTVAINVRHYRLWELIVAGLTMQLKNVESLSLRELERATAALERAQKGQRTAKGLPATLETEQALRAQGQAAVDRLADIFTDAVKEHVTDEQTREKIHQAVVAALREGPSVGTGEPEDPAGLRSIG